VSESDDDSCHWRTLIACPKVAICSSLAIQIPNPREPLAELDDEAVNPAVRAGAASCSSWFSVAVNCTFSAAQIVVGFLSGFSGLIADGAATSRWKASPSSAIIRSSRCQPWPPDKRPLPEIAAATPAELHRGVGHDRLGATGARSI
jgi:hypothetical protein